MRVKIPSFDKKSDLFAYLKKNKAEIIEQKKSSIIKADPFFCKPTLIKKSVDNNKQDSGIVVNPDRVAVKVIANAHYWADSYLDVIIKDAPKKSIEDPANIIYFLKNHGRDTDDIIAIIEAIKLEDISIRDLGLDYDGSTQCVVFYANVMKDFDEKLFYLYLNKQIKQHSIGLVYVEIELAVNFDGEGYEDEFKAWNKYYDQVINKEEVDKYGYFWVIKEYILKENSAVLWGANSLTPTLEVDLKSISYEDGEQDEEKETISLSERIKNYNFTL